MGQFDGMTDSYSHTNRREDIPQATYVTVAAHYSEEVRQSAWEYLCDTHPEMGELKEAGPDDAWMHYLSNGDSAGSYLHRTLNGTYGKFWTSRKERVAA